MIDPSSSRFSEFPNDLDKVVLTPEEMRIYKECSQQAMVKRGVPFGLSAAAGAYFALKAGYLKPNATFGYKPAIGIAALFGCFAGCVSYKAICMQKVLDLPNSTLKQRIEASRKKYQQNLSLSQGVRSPQEPYTKPQGSMISGLQMETYQPSNDFDGFTGVNTDGDQPSNFNLLEPLDKFVSAPTTYDELRQHNRDEYYRSQSSRSQPPPAGNPRYAQPQAPISEEYQSFDRDRVPQYQLVD